MKRTIWIMALTLAAAFLSAPAGGLAATETTLSVALATVPETLDPSAATTDSERRVGWRIFDALTAIDGNGRVIPALAESWRISEDGRTCALDLRKGVKFHNGEPFNANAVIFSWNLGRQGKAGPKSPWELVEYIEKVDDLTIRIVMAAANPSLPSILARHWVIIPPRYYQQVGSAGFHNRPIGTGPFILREWQRPGNIILEANPDYWDRDLQTVSRLIFIPLPDPAARADAMASGAVDIAPRLTAAQADTLRDLPDVEIRDEATDRIYYIAFNNRATPAKNGSAQGDAAALADPRTRRALNHAINLDAIISALFGGYARPAALLREPGEQAAKTTIPPFEYNLNKAKKLLAEAGFSKGFQTTLACPAGANLRLDEVCEAVKADLDAVGVKTELLLLSPADFRALAASGKLPPLYATALPPAQDAPLLSPADALGAPAPLSTWHDPESERLLAEIEAAADQATIADLRRALANHLKNSPPVIYLHQPTTLKAVRRTVEANFFLDSDSKI